MARLAITIQGRPRQISVHSFLKVLNESLSILRELDRAVSERKLGTLEWVVADLRAGSAHVDVESRVKYGTEDFGEAVGRGFVDGVQTVLTERVTPPLFSIDSMTSMYRIVQTFGRDGVSGVTLSLPEAQKSVELSREAEANLHDLVGVHHKSLGSVEGKLELISVHPGSKRFNVYHAVTKKAVRCTLPEDIEDEIVASLRSRVIVSGLVSYNKIGEPLSVKVQRLRILKREHELPSIDRTLGMAPDLTGDLSTEDFIRGLRDG